jgi:hypothetical protein
MEFLIAFDFVILENNGDQENFFITLILLGFSKVKDEHENFLVTPCLLNVWKLKSEQKKVSVTLALLNFLWISGL